jgi:hypothetical protein
MAGIHEYFMKDAISEEKQSLWLRLESTSSADIQLIIGGVSSKIRNYLCTL